MQQFRGAQPFRLLIDDERGFTKPAPEVYMKLNYKNPATISRFLTRSGHLYPVDVLPLHPEAVFLVKRAKQDAIRLGLYPRAGNPFWFRSLKHRPTADRDRYDPTTADVKQSMEHFAFNWLQTLRIKSHFSHAGASGDKRGIGSGEKATQENFYSARSHTQYSSSNSAYQAKDIEFSQKNPTIPGLMSVSGLRKKPFLYGRRNSLRRMGCDNPVAHKKI